ncbi:MAG: hypothetical protein HY077_00580 [Elusimicrobia bacterium]|nr:hypothetical protein [Elusimicrobiota bacterium]
MELSKKAKAWRAQYLRRELCGGLALLACAALSVLAVALAIDRVFALPREARWTLVLAGACALLWGAWSLVLRPWRGFRWETVLDAAAARFPELKDHLKTAWELARLGCSPHTSEELRQAHLRRTESLLAAAPEEPLFRWKASRTLRGTALAAMLGGAAMPWLGAGASWERVLAPWRDVPLERLVAVAPGDARVPWGGPARISARFSAEAPSGRDRRELTLWLEGTGGWKAARWDSVTEAEAGYSIEELSAPLRYRLTWRDLASRTYKLVPVAVPELESLQVRIHGAEPAVAALTAAEPLAVLRGTLLTLTGRPNQALSAARLRLSILPSPISMKLNPSGEYEASFVAAEDATLRFELDTPDGRVNAESAMYAIKALPDLPPKIELLSPLEPLAASPRDTVSVSYTAVDDGALKKVSLLIRSRGTPNRELVLREFSGQREFTGDYAWELAGLPFGKVEFQLKAVDNASPGQSGLSAVGSVEIVDFAASHAQTEAQWTKAEESLKDLARREDSALSRLASGPSPELERELAGLPQAWVDAASQFSRWSKAMERDPYANPGLTESARGQADALEEARQGELPEALRASRAGETARAQELHARLAARARQAQRLLSDGRKLQGLQDFYSEAGRMSQSGSELQSQLDGLTQRGGADAQAVSKLKEGLEKLQKQMEDLQAAMLSLPKLDPNAPEARSRKNYELPLGQARAQADELSKALARGDFAAAARIAQRLSESLAKIQRALADASSDASASNEARQASERLAKAQALWSEVIDDQTKVLERTEALEAKRLEAKVAAQKDMLADLARRQGVLVSSASARGAGFPQDALGLMRSVADELDTRRVAHSASWLRGVSARLRMEPGHPWDAVAAEEDDIRERLDAGPSLPPEAPSPESRAVGEAQGQALAKTRRLRSQLEGIDAETGGVPREALQKLGGAQSEQSAAEGALSSGATTRAKEREEIALSLLSEGSQAMSQAMGGARSKQSGMGQPFSRPSSGAFRVITGGPGSGAQLGFVPLPPPKDYAPPKEIREELKKSLQESRPSSYDGVIKEYFKRISQ